ncbi:MAG: HD domain-containing protein [Proteobacteria bacterium]|nr:HD domain-containing protein [Pseudomonadota bacterium]
MTSNTPTASLAALAQNARYLLERAGLGDLAALAARRGSALYLCGGTVRDLLLDRPAGDPPDVDLAVDGRVWALGRDLASLLGGRFVPLDEEHDTARVVCPRVQIDLVGLRAPTIEGDLLARDFTINALAAPVDNLEGFLDPTGGLNDLDQKIIRHIADENLSEDPLRLMRAFRFMAQLGFEIHPRTKAAIASRAELVAGPAAERTLSELYLILEAPGAAEAVVAMDQTGLLARLFPELEAGRDMDQNPGHHLSVRDHLIETCCQAARLLADPAGRFGPLAEEVRRYAGPRRRHVLLAALLHDLGKPDTKQVEARDEGPWATFYKHESVGEKAWSEIARRLRVSRADAAVIGRLVKLHMRPWHLAGLNREAALSTRAVNRMVLAVGDDLVGLFIVALADARAARGPARPPRLEAEILDLCASALRRQAEIIRPALASPLLDGRQVMELMDLPPGPRVGQLLAALQEAQLQGLIVEADQARQWLRENAPSITGS